MKPSPSPLHQGILSLIASALILLVMVQGTAAAVQDRSYPTGLPELTAQELEWQNKHMKKVKKVKLNRLGLERVNAWRENKGLAPLSDVVVQELGQEMETLTGTDPTSEPSMSDFPSETVPAEIDNSLLPYFPPIRSQGSLGSCGCFSGTYYAMTHMLAMAEGLDAKNGGDAYRLSPKWTYNMVNGGSNVGSWYYWAYEIGQKNGVASWAEFPYDSNYREWSTDADVWKNAIYRRFDTYGYVNDTNTDTGIEQVKQMILNGYVLNIPTYIYSWNWTTIKDDPTTADLDAHTGKRCAFWVNGTEGYHAMTVVGYDDGIWVDINTNNVVDPGEKGAFKIANSWGTGWGDGGYCWMAYDALKSTSAVPGAPSTGRITGWSPARAHWVTARSGYSPVMIAEFSLSHLKRDHLRLTLGTSETGTSTPTVLWYPEAIYNQGGPYAFDGTTTETQGGFAMDFSDLVPQGSRQMRFFLGVQDDTAGDPASLLSYTLIDMANGGTEISCDQTPVTVDSNQIYAYIDYDFYDGNIAPVALIALSDNLGTAPFTITFDGQGSSDQDGSIVSYQWDFGDNTTSTGPVVAHTYTDAGIFTATLTVSDNLGAVDTDHVGIEILPDPNQVVYLADLDGLLNPSAAGTTATVFITVHDINGAPVSGATVYGTWSGLVSGDATATTDTDGIAAVTSRKSKKTGSFTFTVTDIISAGQTYSPEMNVASFFSLSTDDEPDPVNVSPVAAFSATPVNGTAPLHVLFDAGNSYDPDGTITAYSWNFGDGSPEEKGMIPQVSHRFDLPGIYTVTLSVTDDGLASGTAELSIQVQSGETQEIHIESIVMVPIAAGINTSAEASVMVHDSSGIPVAGISVTGEWSGVVNAQSTGITGNDGKATLVSPKTKASGTETFTVMTLTGSGYSYSGGDVISATLEF